MSLKEKSYKLKYTEDGIVEDISLTFFEDGAISFFDLDGSNGHIYLYPKQVKKLKKLITKDVDLAVEEIKKDIIKLERPSKNTIYWVDVLELINEVFGE